MRVPGLATLRRARRRLVKRRAQKAAILMYHRVAEPDPDPWGLAVTPGNFAQQLEVLRRHTQPVSMDALAAAHRAGAIPSRGVAITFDDGYANNLHAAKPLLERFRIPATIFVATGYMDSPREYWWDELDQVLLQPGRLPPQLSLEIRGAIRRWDLGAAVEFGNDEWIRLTEHPAASRQTLAVPRLAFYYSVWNVLQPLSVAERSRALEEVLAWARVTPIARPTHRPMTVAELRQVEQGGMVAVGAHTVTHPLLSAQSPAAQREEIRQSRRQLEQLLGHPISSFSYPFGGYSAATIPLVQEERFEYAVTTAEETVWSRSDRFELPRFAVGDWGGDEFEQRLRRWMDE